MDIMKKMSSRFAMMASPISVTSELKSIANEDLKLYNSLRNEKDRNGFIISCIASFKKKLDPFKNQYDKRYSAEEISNIKSKIAYAESRVLNKLGNGLKTSLSMLLIACLALGFISLLTLILINKKLDKFIRLTSEIFYLTSEMITKVFTRSLGSLLSLSVTDCLEEIIKCTEQYNTAVKKIITEIRYENLDRPAAVLMASSGLMLLIVTFKYYELLRKFRMSNF